MIFIGAGGGVIFIGAGGGVIFIGAGGGVIFIGAGGGVIFIGAGGGVIFIGAGGGVILIGGVYTSGSGTVMGTVGVYVGRSRGGVKEGISVSCSIFVVWGSSEEYNSW